MNLIISQSNNAFFNLAQEEFLFEKTDVDFLLIYINSDAVVVGKHQNAVAESNNQFIFENNIPLVRRFSGGGTVFHDKGNVNFSFITTGQNSRVIDFKRYALPVVSFLKSHGVPASLSERNDILCDGFKISGHAAHAKKNRVLHHGTLLFDSDLEKLSLGLRSDENKFQSRAVKSVRSKVTNIQPHLRNRLDINDFVEMLADSLSKEFQIEEIHNPNDIQTNLIEELVESKYKTFEWNYGYGPPYTFNTKFVHLGESFDFNVNVVEGIITEITELKKSGKADQLQKLKGIPHLWSAVQQNLIQSFGLEAGPLTQHLF